MIHDLVVRKDVDKETPFCHKKYSGKETRRCRRCNNHRGFNRKYGLRMCRRCFYEKAEEIGFKSFD